MKSRTAVLGAIMEQGVVPVFYDPDLDVCKQIIQACCRAGAKCIEFTHRGDFASNLFHALARDIRQADPTIMLGVGSIVDAPTAAIYIAQGAQFIVSPLLNPDIAQLCHRQGLAHIPGCATVTEIGAAQALGCEIIKLFPGSCVGGPDFVKSVMGPMPWTRLMPTGGVDPTEKSLREWYSAGIVACGMGSKLITREQLASKDYKSIEQNVYQVIGLVKMIRSE